MENNLELPSYMQLGATFVDRPVAAPDQNQLAQSERRFEEESAKVTTGDIVDATIENDWVHSSLKRWAEYGGTPYDPDFLLDDKSYADLTKDIAPEYHEAFENARSLEHAQVIRQHLLEKQERDRLFALGGWSGFATRLGMNLVDPVNVLVTLATMPVSVVSKGGRLINAARTGAMVGAENAALESLLYLGDYTKQGEDMFYAVASGLALGGIAGSLHKGSGDAIVETMMEDLSRSATRAMEHLDESQTMRSIQDAVDAAAGEGTAVLNPLSGLREEARAIRQERRDVQAAADFTSGEIARIQDEIASLLSDGATPVSTRAEDAAFVEAEIALKRQALDWLKEYDKRVLLNEKNREKYPASAIPDPDTLEGELRNIVADYLGRKADLKRDLDEIEEYLSKSKNAEADPAEIAARAAKDTERSVQAARLSQKLDKLQKRLEQQQRRLQANARSLEKWRAKRDAEVAARLANVPGVQVPAKADDSAGAMRAITQPINLADDAGERFTTEQKNYGRSWRDDVRYSISAQFSKLKNPLMRWFGHHAVLDSVGRQGDALNVQSASEEMTRLVTTGRVRLNRATNGAFKAWAKANKLGAGRRDYHRGEFGRELARIIRGGEPSPVAEVNAAANAIRDIFREWGEAAQRAGVVGFENFVENPNYLPRIIDFAKFYQLRVDLGDGLYKLIGEAIRRANPDIDPKYAKVIAEGYINKLARLEAGVDFNMNNLASRHTLDTIEDSLRTFRDTDGKPLDRDAIAEIMDALTFDRKKAGLDSKPARAKQRVLMDENTSMQLYDNAIGTTRTVRVDELFENNAELLTQMYMRQMGGRIAMAQLNPQWFGSEQRFESFLKNARKYGSDVLGISDKELTAEEDLARYVWDYLMGRPLETNMDGTYETIARNLRDWNYMRLMGQVGWAQIPEFANIVGFAGWRTMMRHLPAMKDVMMRAKDGSFDDQLQEELELILGTGADWLINPPGIRYDDFGRGSVLMEQGTRVTSAVSGMSAINTFLQRLTARIIAQRFADLAQGVGRMSTAEMRQLGISNEMFEKIKEQLSKHMEIVPGRMFRSAKVRKLNLEKWDRDPKSEQARRVLVGAMNRMARKIVQENDIGNTARWMHTTTGKLLMQFRTFQSGAYEKQLLSNLYLAKEGGQDAWKITQTFGLSTLLASLAYIGQVYTNAAVRADREDYLEEKLKDDRALWSGIARSGYASFLPGLIDTGIWVTGGDPLFAHARTTMQPSNFITGNPTINLANSGLGAVQGLIAPMREDYDYSEANLRDQFGMMALQNTLLGAAAFAAIKESANLPRRSE